MSTPNSLRHAQSVASTPSTTSSSPAASTSNMVEPKSEYLRHALEAQRAKQTTPASTSSPAPIESKPSAPEAASPSTSDPWLEQAKDESFLPRNTPTRRTRRPSDGMAPRKPTIREQQAEVDKLKEALFSQNMKLELISKQNNELKDEIEEANDRIAQLEHLEEDNHDLRETNRHLEDKIEDIYDDYEELQKRNADILQIQEESVQNMELQNNALEEAAEIIFRMEQQKESLARENALLRQQMSNLQAPTTGYHHTGMDGDTKGPARVYSVDESRPSTSHFDSDYYSQPASPQVEASKQSLPSVTVSDRARDFLTLNKVSKKSTHDLKKRMSEASVKVARSKSKVPEAPPTAKSHAESRPIVTQQPVRTPRRTRPSAQLSPSVAGSSNSRKHDQQAPSTPTNQSDGLRGMFRDQLTLDTSSHSSQGASPGFTQSPLESKNLRPVQVPIRSDQVRPNSRTRHERHKPTHRPDSGHGRQSDDPDWDKYSPTDSVATDLTTEPDRDPRTRWWKTVDGLSSGAGGPARALARSRGQPSHLQPNSSGQNFLFNPAESDEEFIAKLKSQMPSRRDR
ncbi:unnamed protein product [Periconia digitata]|uniref:Uncharacterized protein n=1 Tax=Periconia digitata TaxID=1303443 RepID=A0A9W4UA31_9PLEO|nr:unnamed protein product [Periconia digitata]